MMWNSLLCRGVQVVGIYTCFRWFFSTVPSGSGIGGRLSALVGGMIYKTREDILYFLD
jgi:hypothetical protein